MKLAISEDVATKIKDAILTSGDGNDPVMEVAAALDKAINAEDAADRVVEIIVNEDEDDGA